MVYDTLTTVIARSEATKQSRASYAALDCFAEPVIRRRFAPTGWLAMTGSTIASSGNAVRNDNAINRRK
jgi:hypothetical protein